MESLLISVKNVSRTFAGAKALNNIDLETIPDEIHRSAGENGSGRSASTKMISGVHQPDSGITEVNGRTWMKMTPLEAIGAGAQVIYQDFSIFPSLIVMENPTLTTGVTAGRKLADWKHFREIVEEAAAKIGFTVDPDAKVGELSAADKQLATIYRAPTSDAKLIVMDESTIVLTKREVDTLFSIIPDLKARGIAILFVSHKLEEVFEISECFTILRSGEKVITCEHDELDRHEFIKCTTSKEFIEIRFEADTLTEEVVLGAKNLCAAGVSEDVFFFLRGGEILGITGLLGSGRTGLVLALFGSLPATSRMISAKGRNVILSSVQDAIKAGIALAPEDRLTEGLFPTRSIGENIVISGLDSFADALGILDKEKIKREKIRWTQELEVIIPNHEDTVSTPSGGNQREAVLVKWLATKPDVLTLNRPTVGVGIGSKHTIHSILQRLAAQDVATVAIPNGIVEVLTDCSSVLITRGGRIYESIDLATTNEAEFGGFVPRGTIRERVK